MSVVCAVNTKNLGVSQCLDLPQLLRGMITTPRNFKFSAADSIDPVKWQNALLGVPGVRIHKWPDFRDFANNSEATIYESKPLSDLKVRDGKYAFTVSIVQGLCDYLNMYTHNGSGRRVFFVDSENRIYGTVDASNNFKGFLISLLNVEKIALNDGTKATTIPVKVALTNPKELSMTGGYVDGSFYDDLIELVDVDVALVSKAIGLVKVTVKTKCDGVNVSGLVVGDFVYKNAAGAGITITSVTEANGVYSLNQSGNLFITGSANITTPDLLTIPGYESTGAVVVSPLP